MHNTSQYNECHCAESCSAECCYIMSVLMLSVIMLIVISHSATSLLVAILIGDVQSSIELSVIVLTC